MPGSIRWSASAIRDGPQRHLGPLRPGLCRAGGPHLVPLSASQPTAILLFDRALYEQLHSALSDYRERRLLPWPSQAVRRVTFADGSQISRREAGWFDESGAALSIEAVQALLSELGRLTLGEPAVALSPPRRAERPKPSRSGCCWKQTRVSRSSCACGVFACSAMANRDGDCVGRCRGPTPLSAVSACPARPASAGLADGGGDEPGDPAAAICGAVFRAAAGRAASAWLCADGTDRRCRRWGTAARTDRRPGIAAGHRRATHRRRDAVPC